MSDLSTWLYQTLAPDHADMTLEAVQVLELAGSHLRMEIDLFFSNNSETGSADTLDTINSTIITAGIKELRTRGVSINTSRIDILAKVVSGILQLHDTEEVDVLQSFIGSEVSNEEKLAGMIAFLRGESSDNWLRFFVSVSDSFMDSLATHLDASDDDLTEGLVIFKEGLEAYAKKYPRRLMEVAIENGYGPGTPIDGLLAMTKPYLDSLVPNNEVEAAIELIGLALLSHNSKVGLTKAVINAAESHYHDLDFIIKVTGIAGNLIREVGLHG